MTAISQPGASRPITRLRGYQCLFVLLGLVLLWPAVVQREPYAFNDTASYLKGADTAWRAITGAVTGAATDHADTPVAGPAASATNDPTAAEPDSGAGPGMVLYGRSVYFGLFLYLGTLLGSFWVPVVVQALVAGAVIVALVRHFVDPARERAFGAACLTAFAIAAVTSLPFFVCFLMPDLAVGLALVGAVLLLLGWRRERPVWRIGLLLLTTFAALAHSSAVLLIGALGAGGLLASIPWRRQGLAPASLLLLAAALCGIAGELAFGIATHRITGIEPLRPPFLTARLVEGGPGRRYLDEHCRPAAFVLCRHPLRGPVNAEVFLWNETRPQGGFRALPPADRTAVSKEQFRFALAVLRAYPLDTLTALGTDLGRQLMRFDLEEFRPQYGLSALSRGPLEAPPPGQPLPGLQRAISVILAVMCAISVVALAWFTAHRSYARSGQPRAVMLLTASVILANDAVCAWLSGPFARYQTRIVWALPLVVALYVLSRTRLRDEASHQPPAATGR